MRRDVLGTIEAAYRLELGPSEWLHGLGDEFYQQLGGGVGLYGCTYRIVDGARLQVGEELQLEMPPTLQLPFREALEMLPFDFVRQVFTRSDCATQSQFLTPELKPFVESFMAPLAAHGWRDIMCFGGVEPAGCGVYLGAWLNQPGRLAPA